MVYVLYDKSRQQATPHIDSLYFKNAAKDSFFCAPEEKQEETVDNPLWQDYIRGGVVIDSSLPTGHSPLPNDFCEFKKFLNAKFGADADVILQSYYQGVNQGLIQTITFPFVNDTQFLCEFSPNQYSINLYRRDNEIYLDITWHELKIAPIEKEDLKQDQIYPGEICLSYKLTDKDLPQTCHDKGFTKAFQLQKLTASNTILVDLILNRVKLSKVADITNTVAFAQAEEDLRRSIAFEPNSSIKLCATQVLNTTLSKRYNSKVEIRDLTDIMYKTKKLILDPTESTEPYLELAKKTNNNSFLKKLGGVMMMLAGTVLIAGAITMTAVTGGAALATAVPLVLCAAGAVLTSAGYALFNTGRKTTLLATHMENFLTCRKDSLFAKTTNTKASYHIMNSPPIAGGACSPVVCAV